MAVMTSPWSSPPPGGDGWPAYQPQQPHPPQYAPWPGYFTPPPRVDYGVRRDLPVGAAIVLMFALIGVPVGMLWHSVSARPAAVESADGGFQLPADVDKNYFGTDAAFFAITAAAGVVTGAAAWAATRNRGPVVPAAVAVGGVVASVVARAAGERPVTNATLARVCGVDHSYDTICQVYDGHLHVRAVSVMAAWALTAVAAHLVLTAVDSRRPAASSAPVPPVPPVAPWYQPPPPGAPIS
jgi:hypothetical protein